MILDQYNQLREKVINQMQIQVKEVKKTAVEQWAKENGFSQVYFANYEEAINWVEENVNINRKNKKNFNKFEKEIDEILEKLMGDLENGSSSQLEKNIRNISKKYVSPALKVLIKSVAINFLVTQGVGLGLNFVGNEAYDWAISEANKIGEEGVLEMIRNGVKDSITGMHDVYTNSVVPFAKQVTSSVLGFFQARGLIRDAKVNNEITNLNDKNENQESKIEDLKAQIVELRQAANEKKLLEGKRERALLNVGKIQQMQYIVTQLQQFFKDEGINIPEIPERCFTMEEYGIFLRESLNNQNVSPEKCKKVYAVLDIYNNNIGKMCRDLRIGQCNVIDRTKETIENGLEYIRKGFLDIKTGVTFSIESVVQNALRKLVTKEEVDGIPQCTRGSDITREE